MQDAWVLQKKLMNISGQKIASKPELNNTSFLYAALILEEVSELMVGLDKVLTEKDDKDLTTLLLTTLCIGEQAQVASKRLRKHLTIIKDFSLEISKEQAIEIADATTDIAVVNCGFAVASGIDGNACYQETVGSNLSKANPDTGMIEKDNSGKWIKGRDYRPPNLDAILNGF
jgi:predicted HAD superfamily Cof-like phosphohydrolase